MVVVECGFKLCFILASTYLCIVVKGGCLVYVGTLLVVAIKCYQCYAAFNISCTDVLIHDGGVQPMDCDHVFEAAYCVKTTGLYAGNYLQCSQWRAHISDLLLCGTQLAPGIWKPFFYSSSHYQSKK